MVYYLHFKNNKNCLIHSSIQISFHGLNKIIILRQPQILKMRKNFQLSEFSQIYSTLKLMIY